MYPSRYQLPELTAHVLASLERRREAFAEWSPAVEAKLTEEAKVALADAGRQFAELADDRPWFHSVEQAVLTVALPRYFLLARAEQLKQQSGYGVWRGGDLISRAAYAAAGLVAAAVVWRTGIPKWVEPLPLGLFLLGPLIPDLQAWFARRSYARQLSRLVADMAAESAQKELYRPMMDAVDEHVGASSRAEPNKDKHNQGA